MQLDAAFKEVESNQGCLVQAEAYGVAFSKLAMRAHPCLALIEAASRAA